MIYNFPDHYSGDTFKGISSITLLENGIPINLTNCGVYAQFRSITNLANPVVFEFSSDLQNVIIISPSLGMITIPEQMIDVPAGDYDYDLQVIFPNGYIKTYLKGRIKILPQTTRIKNIGRPYNSLTPTSTPYPVSTPTPTPTFNTTVTITPTPTPTSIYGGYSC
jgi:hypothetical protein